MVFEDTNFILIVKYQIFDLNLIKLSTNTDTYQIACLTLLIVSQCKYNLHFKFNKNNYYKL